MWSCAWNKRKLTSENSNRFLPSTVSRALDWWSGGCGFKSHWGQFLTKFILCQISPSWKTRLLLSYCTDLCGESFVHKLSMQCSILNIIHNFAVKDQCAEAVCQTLNTCLFNDSATRCYCTKLWIGPSCKYGQNLKLTLVRLLGFHSQ